MWESKGEAARRRRGCVGASAVDFEGEDAEGEPAVSNLSANPFYSQYSSALTFVVLLCRLVDDSGML
jgi:hypothetical protein